MNARAKDEVEFLDNMVVVCGYCNSDEDYLGYEKVEERINDLRAGIQILEGTK